MKRILALVLPLSLLLCGCKVAEPTTEPTPAETQITTAASNEVVTDPTQIPVPSTSEMPTDPTPQEKVTVYLLEESVLCDNGYTQYFYDENYNVDKCESFTIENDLRYTSYYEDKNVGGMPGKIREVWDSDYENVSTLTWSQDGKILKEVYGSVLEYVYDTDGKLVEKREYYEGNLSCTISYEYDGDVLLRVYCIDTDDHLCYECRAENGCIVEQIYYDEDGYVSCAYDYKYDENGSLKQSVERFEEETYPLETYTYKAVEVDAERAQYLIEQQKFLVAIA